jgi:hypothetical protein
MVHVHGRRRVGATMPPEGKDNLKGQACLGCKRNGIQTETYGFARQKTRGGSRNLILISDMSFLVDFRPEKASGRGHKNNEGYSGPRVDHSLTSC